METKTSSSTPTLKSTVDLQYSSHKESPSSTQRTGEGTLKGGITAHDIDRIIDSLEDSDSDNGEVLDLSLSPVLTVNRGEMEALAPGRLHPSEGSSSELSDVLQSPTPSRCQDIEKVVKDSSLPNTPVKRGTSSQSPCAFEKNPPIWASSPAKSHVPWGEADVDLFEVEDEEEPESIVQKSNRVLNNSEAGSPIETFKETRSPSMKAAAPRNRDSFTQSKVPTPPLEEDEFMVVDEDIAPFSLSRAKSSRPRQKQGTSSASEDLGSTGKGSKDSPIEEDGDSGATGKRQAASLRRRQKKVKTASSQSSTASENSPVKKGSSQSPSKAASRSTPVKKGSSQSPIKAASRSTPVKKGSSQSPIKAASRSTPVKRKDRSEEEKDASSDEGIRKASSRKTSQITSSSDESPNRNTSQIILSSDERNSSPNKDSVGVSGKRQRKPPGEWWLSHGIEVEGEEEPQDAEDLPTSGKKTKPSPRSPSKMPKRTREHPSRAAGDVEVGATKKQPGQKGDGSPENGNMAISPKPQRGAPEPPLKGKLASTPKAVRSSFLAEVLGSSPSTGSATSKRHKIEDNISFPVQEEQASPPSDFSLLEDAASDSVEHPSVEEDAGDSGEDPSVEDAAGDSGKFPAVEDAGDSVEQSPVKEPASVVTETSVRSSPSGFSFPNRNRLSDDKSQGFVSGPSSILELDTREEEDAFLPSSSVRSALSATEMCAHPLAPVSLEARDEEGLTAWLNTLMPAPVNGAVPGPITPDDFQWFSHRGKVLGICTDILHDHCCVGKVLLGSNMLKPLWVDHSATTAYHVLTSCVALTIDCKTSHYNTGRSFIVPCGHAHSLKNLCEEPVVLFYTRMLAPGPDTDDQ